MSDSKVVLTLKGGTGYDAPWIVIHADNALEASQLLAGVGGSGLPEQIVTASKDLQARVTAGVAMGTTFVSSAPAADPVSQPITAQAQQYAQPAQPQYTANPDGTIQFPQQPQQAAPAGQACPHGAMSWKTGGGGDTGKREWKGWFCPTPKGTPGQCQPQFVR